MNAAALLRRYRTTLHANDTPMFTATPPATTSASPPDPALRRELRQRLLLLPYRACLQVVIHLLSAQGYTRVLPAGRERWKGRNSAGGWDIEAELETRLTGRLRAIAQVKQFDTLPVQQRSVDELRGVCLRAGAHQALLVTLSTFSSVAEQAAQVERRIAPVRLIDGEALLDLLLTHGIGVKSEGDGLAPDDGYFDRLCERFSGPGRERRRAHVPPAQPPRTAALPPMAHGPSVTVVVRVSRAQSGGAQGHPQQPGR
jgi:hypothetical protein